MEKRYICGMSKIMNRVFLHTGSNLGVPETYLAAANILIEEEIGTIIQRSGLYHTKAWGITDQPDFLNQALEVHSTCNARQLLERIQEIEKKIGRVREIKWGPRIIDIDILFFNNQIIQEEDLIIPHAHLHERNFVLAPLVEIAPDLIHPVLHKNITELLLESKDELPAIPMRSSF